MTRTTSTLVLALVAGGLLLSTGCAARPVIESRHEWHRLVKIPKVETDRDRKSRERRERRGGETESDSKEETAHQAIWLGRYVWEPYLDEHGREQVRLKGIEVLFCPGDKADFTQCRTGVAWSRAQDRMGQRVGGQ
jgi:hypothetical protein